MSAVFDIPRFMDQTQNLLEMKLEIAYTMQKIDSLNNLRLLYGDREVIYSLDRNRNIIPRSGFSASVMAMRDMYVDAFAGPLNIDNPSSELLYQRYCYGSNIKREKDDIQDVSAILSRHAAEGIIINQILSKADRWHVDYPAQFRATMMAVADLYEVELIQSILKKQDIGDRVGRDLLLMSISSGQMSQGTANTILHKLPGIYDKDRKTLRALMVAEFYERLYILYPRWGRNKDHQKILYGVVKKSSFKIRDKLLYTIMKGLKLYRVGPAIFMIHGSDGFVFDHASLHNSVLCTRRVAGVLMYGSNGRLFGNLNTTPTDLYPAIQKVLIWMYESVYASKTGASRCMHLARHMKVALNMIVNKIHDKAEHFDTKTQAKHEELMKELDKYPVRNNTFYDMLTKLDINDRNRLDIAYMFHLLPPPDCDTISVHNRTIETFKCAHNPVNLKAFMNYTDAVITARCIQIFGRAAKVECDDDYNIFTTDFYRSALKGTNKIQPKQDWGKSRIIAQFPYTKYMESWYAEAGDKTHIYCDPNHYNTLMPSYDDQLSRKDWNELLYAMEYAPLLSGRVKPTDARELIKEGKRPGKCVMVESIKAENAKPPEKGRETHSADDISREVMTELDRNAIPATTILPGCNMRAPEGKADRTMNRMIDRQRVIKKEPTITVSLDVASWSGKLPRRLVAEMNKKLLELTDAPKNLTLDNVWKTVTIISNKRGIILENITTDGCFQGLTGTTDTVLHYLLIGYAVHRARDIGILRAGETAVVTTQIDDAVIHVKLKERRTAVELSEICQQLMDSIATTYLEMGAEIDMVKTIISSIKTHFLNRLYLEGTEVVESMKVAIKVSRELTARYTGPLAQANAIINGYYGAVKRGHDPFIAYKMAVQMAYAHLATVVPQLTKYDSLEIACTWSLPISNGGWSLPDFNQFMMHDMGDALATWIHLMKSAATVYDIRNFRSLFLGYMHTICTYPFVVRSYRELLEAPRNIQIKRPTTTVGILRSKIEKHLRSKTTSKSYKNLLDVVDFRLSESNAMAIVQATTWDASLLEALFANTSTSVAESIIAAGLSNEIVTTLMTGKEKARLGSNIAFASRDEVLFGVEMLGTRHHAEDVPTEFYLTSSATYITTELRDRFYEFIGAKIFNHTPPILQETLMRTNDKDRAMMLVSMPSYCPVHPDTTASVWGSTFDNYNNMYDMAFGRGRNTAAASRGVVQHDSRVVKSKPKAGAMMANTIMLVDYCNKVSEPDTPGLNRLWDLLFAVFGGTEPTPMPAVTQYIDKSVSTKRTPGRLSNTRYAIAAFPNCSHAVEVEATRLFNFLDAHPTRLNGVAIITYAKKLWVTEVATSGDITAEMYFNLSPLVVFSGVPRLFATTTEDDEEIESIIAGIMASNNAESMAFALDAIEAAATDDFMVPTYGDILGLNRIDPDEEREDHDEYEHELKIAKTYATKPKAGQFAMASMLGPVLMSMVGQERALDKFHRKRHNREKRWAETQNLTSIDIASVQSGKSAKAVFEKAKGKYGVTDGVAALSAVMSKMSTILPTKHGNSPYWETWDHILTNPVEAIRSFPSKLREAYNSARRIEQEVLSKIGKKEVNFLMPKTSQKPEPATHKGKKKVVHNFCADEVKKALRMQSPKNEWSKATMSAAMILALCIYGRHPRPESYRSASVCLPSTLKKIHGYASVRTSAVMSRYVRNIKSKSKSTDKEWAMPQLTSWQEKIYSMIKGIAKVSDRSKFDYINSNHGSESYIRYAIYTASYQSVSEVSSFLAWYDSFSTTLEAEEIVTLLNVPGESSVDTMTTMILSETSSYKQDAIAGDWSNRWLRLQNYIQMNHPFAMQLIISCVSDAVVAFATRTQMLRKTQTTVPAQPVQMGLSSLLSTLAVSVPTANIGAAVSAVKDAEDEEDSESSKRFAWAMVEEFRERLMYYYLIGDDESAKHMIVSRKYEENTPTSSFEMEDMDYIAYIDSMIHDATEEGAYEII